MLEEAQFNTNAKGVCKKWKVSVEYQKREKLFITEDTIAIRYVNLRR